MSKGYGFHQNNTCLSQTCPLHPSPKRFSFVWHFLLLHKHFSFMCLRALMQPPPHPALSLLQIRTEINNYWVIRLVSPLWTSWKLWPCEASATDLIVLTHRGLWIGGAAYHSCPVWSLLRSSIKDTHASQVCVSCFSFKTAFRLRSATGFLRQSCQARCGEIYRFSWRFHVGMLCVVSRLLVNFNFWIQSRYQSCLFLETLKTETY